MNHRKMKKEYINPSVSVTAIVGLGGLMKISNDTKPGGGGPEPGETPLSGAPKHRPF